MTSWKNLAVCAFVVSAGCSSPETLGTSPVPTYADICNKRYAEYRQRNRADRAQAVQELKKKLAGSGFAAERQTDAIRFEENSYDMELKRADDMRQDCAYTGNWGGELVTH